MPLSSSRDYLSIGEVLESIRRDFPDISISKIRFLESEGLIAPERTASGYRKFYEADVARLRYILSLQRDQFLPLKVIRERLSQAESDGGNYPEGGRPEAAVPDAGAKPASAPVAPSDVSMDRAELRVASGLSEQQLASLEEFGILQSGGTYDGNDLTIATATHRLLAYGVEPRHLRMYRQFAEREGAFFEQIVSPVTRRRAEGAHEQAAQSVRELLDLSRQLREALLRSNLAELL